MNSPTRDGEAAEEGDQLDDDGQTVFNFRNFSGGDLINFYLKAADGGSGRDPLWLDDIHIEKVDGSENLANPVPEPHPGDANRDSRVDVFDLSILGSNYLAGGSKTWSDGNFDGDMDVDVFDLSILANNYGFDTGGEPTPDPPASPAGHGRPCTRQTEALDFRSTQQPSGLTPSDG